MDNAEDADVDDTDGDNVGDDVGDKEDDAGEELKAYEDEKKWETTIVEDLLETIGFGWE